MRVLVRARNCVADADLWPYATRAERVGGGSVLLVEVRDGRELVGVLVALVERGVDVTSVDPIGGPSPSL